MSADSHKYNGRYHRNGEKFNNEPRPEWDTLTDNDRQQANDALDALIRKTRESLED